MLFAMLLLLGHQMVPHVHDLPASETSFSAPTTTELGWLGRVFSLDQGADHLEHFRPNADTEAAWDLQVVPCPQPFLGALSGLSPLQSVTYNIPEAVPLPKGPIASAQPLRGPPICC